MTITTANQGKITTMGGTSGLVDQTDKMHSGLIKALEVFGQGRKIMGHAGFEIYDSGLYVGYRLKQPIHFVTYGRHVTYETNLEVPYTSQQRDANYDKYDWVVLVPNHGGNPALLIVPGTLDGANALVSDITEGCIPVALIKVPAGTDTDDTAGYQAQLYTFNNRTQDLSLGYDDGATPPYYKNTLTATSAAGGTTFTNTIGDLIFDNTDVNDQIVMRLGTDTTATAFEVRNDSDTAAFKVNGLSATDVVGNLVVTQGSAGGQIALKIDNDDVDKVALGIEAANTTANVLDITANAVTTGTAIKSSSTALTNGAAIDLVSTSTPADGSGSTPHTFKTTQAGTGTHTVKGLLVDVNKTGVTDNGKTTTLTGIHLDVDDTATNNSVGTVTMTGLDIDVNSASDTGTIKNIGLDINVDGADTNYSALFNGGNVGIGTTAPERTLEIEATSNPGIRIQETGQSGYLEMFGLADSQAQIKATNATSGETCNLDIDVSTVSGNNQVVRFFRNANTSSAGIIQVHDPGETTVTLTVEAANGKTSIGSGTVDANSMLTVEGAISLGEIGAPPTNTAGRAQLYALQGDRHLRYVDGAGVDLPILLGGKHSIWIPAEAISPRSNAGCGALATTAAATNGRPDIRALPFDKDSDEHGQFTIAMPATWNAGTVTAQFYWTSTSSTTSHDVTWAIQGVSLTNDNPIDTAFGTAVVKHDTVIAAKDLHISDETSAITVAGAGAGELVCFQVYRDVDGNGTAANDDLNVDALLMGVRIFYTISRGNES